MKDEKKIKDFKFHYSSFPSKSRIPGYFFCSLHRRRKQACIHRSGQNAMKRACILLVVWFGWVPCAHAQSADIYKLVPGDTARYIVIGPLLSGGACFNTGIVAADINTSPGLDVSAGADAEFPLTRSISLSLALAFDARSVNFQQNGNNASEVNYNFDYIVLRPELSFEGFLIGAGVGIPVSSGVSGPGTAGAPVTFGTSAMNILVELRIGTCIPVMRSTSGVLDLTIEGAYALTQIASSELTPAGATGTPATSINNGPLVTAEIGLQYLFDLTSH
jgi:hypothetical protein